MSSVRTIDDVLTEGRSILSENNIDTREARLLLAYSMGISSDDLIKHKECKDEEYVSFINNVNKRIMGIPYAYITGKKEFMKLTFKVNENTLIPRDDTEVLVQKAIEIINDLKEAKKQVEIDKKRKNKLRVLDMCTGSGCIAISISKYNPDCIVDGADISAEAIKIASENAYDNNVKVSFIKSDLFKRIHYKYDLIVSNPPYIESETIDTLQKEVQNEPRIALDGGVDGLDFYRKISKESRKYLNDGGFLLFEIGFNQGDSVSKILKEDDYKDIEVIKDLSEKDRVVVAHI